MVSGFLMPGGHQPAPVVKTLEGADETILRQFDDRLAELVGIAGGAWET